MSKTKNATATSQWNARSLRVQRRTSAGARLAFGLSSRVAIPSKLCVGAPGVVGRADALALLLKAYVRSLSLADDSSAPRSYAPVMTLSWLGLGGGLIGLSLVTATTSLGHRR